MLVEVKLAISYAEVCQVSASDIRKQFRRLLASGDVIIAPGVFDALSVRLVERAGYPAALVSGAAVSASVLGLPDLGFLTMTESLRQTRGIVNATSIAVIADCDTGYGSPLTVTRTIREFENAGVAALFIEDQVDPKRCGHFDGKRVVSIDDMVSKLHAARDARSDPDLTLIARTDARATEGLDAALRRVSAYAAAGADVVFVEAPESEAELAAIGKSAPVPLMVNMVEGGRTPLLPVEKLAQMNYSIVTYSGTLQKAAIRAMADVLKHLAQHGDVSGLFPSAIVSLAERSEILRLGDYQELERLYDRARP